MRETGWVILVVVGVCFLWLLEVANTREKPEPVKCLQVEQSTYGYTEPRNDKRIGHPLPPGPMKPSSWG